MNQPLTTTQLDSFMMKCMGPEIFKGVFASDHLPNMDLYSYPYCIIANTDCCHKGGAHWIGMYFDRCGDGHYFDSYGMEPKNITWIKYLVENSRNGHWTMQRRSIQGQFTPYCGHYVTLYLIRRHLESLVVSDYKLMLDINDSNVVNTLMKYLYKN